MKSLDSYPDVLTVSQVAQIQNVCAKTARKWCLMKEGALPSFKVGNIRRIKKEAFITWVEEHEEGGVNQ
jgi:excisionase family DNA binding protein